jgi:hypothetical protein
MHSTADASLYEIANSIQQQIRVQRDRLAGNETRGIYNDWDEVPLSQRLFHARFAPGTNAYGPTPEQRESLEIGLRLYQDVKATLVNVVEVEYEGLKQAMDQAGVPWTPGRGIQ